MSRAVTENKPLDTSAPTWAAAGAVYPILISISFCHLLNDLIQSLLPAIYPILKSSYHLDFGEVGMITLCNQLTASILQPVVGHAMDKRPAPYSLTAGMCCMFAGLFLLAYAPLYGMILLAASLTGIGSAIFHPESSRVARMASGGQHGLAQSIFQLGGNFGSSLGPLLAAFIVLPNGQHSVVWFTAVAVIGMIITYRVGGWYKERVAGRARGQKYQETATHGLSTGRVRLSISVLLALMFSKFFYLASLTSYYTFYLIDKFHVSVRFSQYSLFVFLASVAAGTIIGGPVGDRLGRKLVIWCSILGVLPFSLILPHARLAWTIVLTVPIGIILASAFPAIIVYAQELLPGRIGLISGLFFGLAFGLGGIGAAVLGELADKTSIHFVYQVCAFLPAIGLLTALLPNIERPKPVRI